MYTTVEVVVLSFLRTASPGFTWWVNQFWSLSIWCPKPSVPILQLVFQHNQGFGFHFGSSVVTKPGVVGIAGVAGVSGFGSAGVSVDGLNGSNSLSAPLIGGFSGRSTLELLVVLVLAQLVLLALQVYH